MRLPHGRLRTLYLLALAQLVGGPLVLLHVVLFSQLVVREAPRVGFGHALAAAWDSPEFQQRLDAAAALPDRNPRERREKNGFKPDLGKVVRSETSIAFSARRFLPPVAVISAAPHLDTPTPAWPNAPPGPPPRIG